MTLPKGISKCPLCLRKYADLSGHLRRSHSVRNKDERSILLKLGSGRINLRAVPCPIPGCQYHQRRLDKHLQAGHPEVSTGRMEAIIYGLKKKTAIAMLAELRAENPMIGMSSELDVEAEVAQVDEAYLGPSADEEEEEGQGEAETCDICRPIRIENLRLRKEVERLSAETRGLRRTARLLQRRLAKARNGESSSEDEDGALDEAPDTAGAPKKAPQSQDAPASTPRPEKPAPASSPTCLSFQTPHSAPTPQSDKPAPTPTPRSAPASTPRAKKPAPAPTPRSGPTPHSAPTASGSGSAAASPSDQLVPGQNMEESFIDKRGRASKLRQIIFPRSVEEYLAEYQRYQAGAAASGKRTEGSVSKVSRIKAFLYFMARGKGDLYNWLFIGDMAKIRG